MAIVASVVSRTDALSEFTYDGGTPRTRPSIPDDFSSDGFAVGQTQLRKALCQLRPACERQVDEYARDARRVSEAGAGARDTPWAAHHEKTGALFEI